jgi:hypothetical protein
MLWLQVLEHRSNGFRFWDRVSLWNETKRNDEDDDATVELVSTTDSDEEEARSCLQQLVMEDNRENAHLTWEDVQSQLMSTLATLYKKSSNPTLPRYDYDDDDDDYDALRVLYHGSYGGIAEEDRVPLQKRSYLDVAAETQLYDFCCNVIQNECRDLFQNHNVWDVRIYQSLLVLLISQGTSEEDFGHVLFVDDAVRSVATFLIDPSLVVDVKLSVLQILFLPQFTRMGCDDEAGNSAFRVAEKGITILQHHILREVYAFCIAICFGVNDLEYAFGSSITGVSGPSISPMLLELRSTCLYMQEVHSIFYDVSNSRPLSNPSTPGNLDRSEQLWEQAKSHLFETNSILLKDLDVLRSLYNTLGIRHVVILASVGYLRIHSNHSTDAVAHTKYCEALHNVAQFLVDWMISHRQKFAVLKCLQLSIESTTMTDRIFYGKVLSFCIDPNAYTDSFSLTNAAGGYDADSCSYYLLLWELRVLCGHYLPQQRLRNILRLLWTKALPRVRVTMNVVGRMKHSLGAIVVPSAQTVLSKYRSSPNSAL